MPDRIIKESICTSETLNLLTDFEERFWHRLTVNCDDFGRFDARPAILKGRLFPLAEGKTLKNIADALNKLASVGLVSIYEVDGRPFLQVVTWDKHQRIRAKRSKYPAPEDGACCQLTAIDGKCPRNPIQSESNPNPNPNPKGSADADRAADFERFWDSYPNKVNKQGAKKAFMKVDVPVDVLLCALENHKQSAQWVKDGGQFIPHPTTWLNQRRWESELPRDNSVPKGCSGFGEAELEAIRRMLDDEGGGGNAEIS